jgi:hypothetical protein
LTSEIKSELPSDPLALVAIWQRCQNGRDKLMAVVRLSQAKQLVKNRLGKSKKEGKGEGEGKLTIHPVSYRPKVEVEIDETLDETIVIQRQERKGNQEKKRCPICFDIALRESNKTDGTKLYRCRTCCKYLVEDWRGEGKLKLAPTVDRLKAKCPGCSAGLHKHRKIVRLPQLNRVRCPKCKLVFIVVGDLSDSFKAIPQQEYFFERGINININRIKQ